MSDRGVKRLPVVKDDKLVGIVSRTDLVRAFVRSDDEIRREIQEDVLRRTLWLEVPEAVHVQVKRGAVRLSGQVEAVTDAVVVQKLVARVPGVVGLGRSSPGGSTTPSERGANTSPAHFTAVDPSRAAVDRAGGVVDVCAA